MVKPRSAVIAGLVAAAIAIACILTPSDFLDPTGSDPTPGPTRPAGVEIEHIPVDGRLVTCITRSSQGISCDWANARPLDAGSTTPTASQTSQTP